MVLYETENLIIRHWKSEDAPDLFEYCSDPDATKYLTFPTYQSISEAYFRIEFMTRRYNTHKDGIDFAIELKGSQKSRIKKVIGSIGLHRFSEKRARTVELGFIIHPDFQTSKYMPEALIGMFKYIRDNNMAWRIEAIYNLENDNIGAILTRAGMRFEGIMRKAWTDKSKQRADVALYSTLVEEI